MNQTINEPVGVVAVFHPSMDKAVPRRVNWNHETYNIRKVDMTLAVNDGKTVHHIYCVYDGQNYLNLDFNAQTMRWQLESISDTPA